MILARLLPGIAAAAFALLTTGCFTGVESTPRIGYDQVKAAQAAGGQSEEQLFIEGVKPQPPRLWQTGKRFMICDGRVGRIFRPTETEDDRRRGQILRYQGYEPAMSLTGENAADIIFDDLAGNRHRYRLPSGDIAHIDTLDRLDIPFTIDLDLIAAADSTLRGRELFVRTSRWYEIGGVHNPVKGLRHIAVRIDSVVPGTTDFPAAVCFTDTVRSQSGMVLMSIGQRRSDTRPFDRLFSFSDPRNIYPEITDDVWDKIIHSRVADGMTRDECRLALGRPDEILRIPTYSGMAERWLYTDGVYLIFEDGYLSKFRM